MGRERTCQRQGWGTRSKEEQQEKEQTGRERQGQVTQLLIGVVAAGITGRITLAANVSTEQYLHVRFQIPAHLMTPHLAVLLVKKYDMVRCCQVCMYWGLDMPRATRPSP